MFIHKHINILFKNGDFRNRMNLNKKNTVLCLDEIFTERQ